ncbi:hypothetical protein DFH28DRAFT_1084328 [Melampsora americana]|nr:hypothetical protein DFH28DRAFT_1084328 [Melampsora americana]
MKFSKFSRICSGSMLICTLLTSGLTASSLARRTINSPTGLLYSFSIHATLLVYKPTVVAADQGTTDTTNTVCLPTSIDDQFDIDDTQEDILKKIFELDRNHSDIKPRCQSTWPIQPFSACPSKYDESDEQDSSGFISDEIVDSDPVIEDEMVGRKSNVRVHRTSRDPSKAHISTTLKKLFWLKDFILPYRLMARCFRLIRDTIRFVFITSWRLGSGFGMFIVRIGQFLWEEILFPLLFPIRLLYYIFIRLPSIIATRIYRAVKPLLVFLASGVTLGILMGLLGAMTHGIIGDWILSRHKSRTGTMIPAIPGVVSPSDLQQQQSPSQLGRDFILDDKDIYRSGAKKSYSDSWDGNLSLQDNQGTTTATKLGMGVTRHRVPTSSTREADLFNPHTSDEPYFKASNIQEPIVQRRDRSLSGSSNTSKTSSIMKGSGKKSSNHHPSESSVSGTSSSSHKGKKKKVTFKND